MIEATRNQLGNLDNKFQTPVKRVLTVCSAGILRSPTLANVLHQKWGFNTRSCGASIEFALIPITEALIYWADEIVFVDYNSFDVCQSDVDTKEAIQLSEAKVTVLDIPDVHDWNERVLIDACITQYRNSIE